VGKGGCCCNGGWERLRNGSCFKGFGKGCRWRQLRYTVSGDHCKDERKGSKAGVVRVRVSLWGRRVGSGNGSRRMAIDAREKEIMSYVVILGKVGKQDVREGEW
jgi:hypothetical protein